jgi:alcohol dehydrogenase (cytochrome c)
MAADAASGKPLWEFHTNQPQRASPMTYVFDNKQYVAIATGQGILAFTLP